MTPAVHLRPVEPADIRTLYANQRDPEAVRMAVVFPRDEAAFAAHWAAALADPAVVARAVLAGDVLVGYVTSFIADGERAIGYWIARDYWGRGIATRAVGLLLAELPARPIVAHAARDNVGSIRVLERNGFRVTGYETTDHGGRFPLCEEARLVLD